ncbi:MAG: S8 family peptidase [Candidatus Eisenbacteria sp.]|nr:S8 family peptidase [Candidatus Eisenbacteria bacterium]
MDFPGNRHRMVGSVLAGLLLGLAATPAAAGPSPLAPSLSYLAQEKSPAILKSPAFQADGLFLSLRFRSTLADERIVELEQQGFRFDRDGGEVRHLDSIYPVRVAPGNMAKVGNLPDLEWAECGWRPGIVPCLNVSRDEVRASAAWDLGSDGTGLLAGQGVLIADFDTGVDVYHPAFWFADGDTLEWVDVNGTRRFEDGVDGVDFNGDGLIGPDETLGFWDGKVEDPHNMIPNDLGQFEADRDWLYLDRNRNGVRDVGIDNGFSEFDPAFGEPIFLVIDSNGDNTLDVGERLASLGTCKVRAILEPGAKERRRGRDLIWAGRDERGHGTSVAGVLVGEAPGRLLAGIAPGAELLVADAFAGMDLGQLILWGLDQGADVMLHELGTWVWDYMDGSSNAERMIDLAAAKGVVQIVAAGNLAGSGKHCRSTVEGESPSRIRMRCPASEGIHTIWGSFLWRTPAKDLRIRIRSPRNSWVTLSGSGTQSAGGVQYWSYRGTSPRGTAGMFFSIEGEADLGGDWLVEIQGSSEPVTVDGYVSDDESGWIGGTLFLDGVCDEGTVGWPANADSAITVTSYATRDLAVDTGSLSRFSSRGPRIDGQAVIDLAAPGNHDIRACRSSGQSGVPIGTYTSFGGTSAAAAHVAGIAALVLQANRDLRHSGTRYVLVETAAADEYTRDVPNLSWGYGKVDALAAVAMALDIEVPPFVDPFLPMSRISLEQNYPNPFNPMTTIRFTSVTSGEMSVRIYDVQGRMVRVLMDQFVARGEWETHWDGTDDWGRRVASGFYYCRLRFRDESHSRKMLLLE